MLASGSPDANPTATAAYRVLEEGLQAAMDEGSVTGVKEDIALAAWCAVHGAATLFVDGPLSTEGRSAEEIANVVTVVLGVGFIPRS
jgi:hypothetical protein